MTWASIVEGFQLLPAPARRQARDHRDLPDGAIGGAVAFHYVAALPDESLVGLRGVELPVQGPDQASGELMCCWTMAEPHWCR